MAGLAGGQPNACLFVCTRNKERSFCKKWRHTRLLWTSSFKGGRTQQFRNRGHGYDALYRTARSNELPQIGKHDAEYGYVIWLIIFRLLQRRGRYRRRRRRFRCILKFNGKTWFTFHSYVQFFAVFLKPVLPEKTSGSAGFFFGVSERKRATVAAHPFRRLVESHNRKTAFR